MAVQNEQKNRHSRRGQLSLSAQESVVFSLTGITILNPGLLPWLLALGIPILLHLLTRQTRRVYVLPTYRFLLRSAAQQSQVFRLRHWLLLALRTLALLFLVLTFLKPTRTTLLANPTGAKRALVIVLDTSLSMGYTRGGVSSLAKVRGQVVGLLEALRPGDVANVILAGAAPTPLLPEIGTDFGTLRQKTRTISPTYERADIPAALALAAAELAKVSAPQKQMILASDFQRTDWASAKFAGLPPDTRLIFLRSEENERENTGITGLRLRPPFPRAGEAASVVATVWNGTPTPRQIAVTVTLQTQGDAPATFEKQQSLTVPAYASGETVFPLSFPDSGRYRITAHIPADSLPADDTRYLVADLHHSLNVLLLTDADLHDGRSATYFLSRALNPAPDSPGGFRILSKHPAALTETDLKSSDIVLLSEAAQFPPDRLTSLARYVAEGGSLIVFLTGPHILSQMQAFGRLLKAGDSLPFVPQFLLTVANKRTRRYLRLTQARYESPLLALFKDPAAGDLGKIRFTRFFITGPPSPKAEVLLAYEDGTPAAARQSLGAGSLLFCNFSPAPNDSDLARQELFPPLMHEFIQGMTAKTTEQRDFIAGGPASTTIEPALAKEEVTALTPGGANERVVIDKFGGGVIIEKAEEAGFHTIRAGRQEAALLAVNPAPDESDLRALDPRTLEGKDGPRASALIEAGGASLAQMEQGTPLWPYCLLAALAALLLEQFVATFGGQARLRTKP